MGKESLGCWHPLRTRSARRLAVDETVILLTLSLHHYLSTDERERGECSRMTVSSPATAAIEVHSADV